MADRSGGGHAAGASRPTLIVVRKHKKHHTPHHGGAWKVAYADFVTAMMAFFLVMWLVNQNKDVKTAVGGYFRDPLGTEQLAGSKSSQGADGILSAGSGATEGQSGILELPASRAMEQAAHEREEEQLERLAERVREVLADLPGFSEISHLVQVELTEEGLRIELMESEKGTFFERGSRQLTGVGSEVVRVLAPTIAASRHAVVIEGHTDSLAYASESYSNWDLSTDRANAARKLLVAKGLDRSQIKEIRGYAAERPRFTERPEDPRNRRISILMPLPESPSS
ncbi:OmpA family protein [Myxococcota bacterium]|nr:OmpA family protein [Myxococcota bacterium]